MSRVDRLIERFGVLWCRLSRSHFLEPVWHGPWHTGCTSCTWCVECDRMLGRAEVDWD